MTVESLAADDARWDGLVDASPTPDVYFRSGYCRAYEAAGEGRVVAVKTETALFPLLLRELPFGEDGFDAVTPYGYGGVLPLTKDADLVTDVSRLRDWCATNGVVTALLRLHPLLGAFDHLSEVDGVGIQAHGPTTAVDLAKVENGRLTGMSKGRKADLNVARRELELSWESGEAGLERFRTVYDETMTRIGARDYYLFPPEYYRTLAAASAKGWASRSR